MLEGRQFLALWVIYDFVNSLMIINGSIYYSQWLVSEEGISQGYYGLAYAVSTLLLLIAAPLLGTVIDRSKVGLRILYYCSTAMGALGVLIWTLGNQESQLLRHFGTLTAFGAIVFVYQLSLVAYNWVLRGLPGLTGRSGAKIVSGYGEAAGSLGSVTGALLGAWVFSLFSTPEARELKVILIMSVVFLASSFPVVFLMRRLALSMMQPAAPEPEASSRELSSASWNETWGVLKSNAALWRYLLVFMLYADALLTVQLYLPVFLREGVHLAPGRIPVAFALALVFGAVGSWSFSYMSRRWRSIDIILVVLVLWTGNLLWLATVPLGKSFWLSMMVSGMLFGILWAASRALMYEIVEPADLGRGFGFYAIFERAASVLGPLLWGLAVGSGRYGTAMTTMAGLVALSAILLGLWARKTIQAGIRT